MKNWIEKRVHQRAPIRIAATAVMDDGVIREDVLVVNLSRSGAMVEVAESIHLPDAFTLLFQHSLEPCKIVWREAQYAGLRFDNTLAEA